MKEKILIELKKKFPGLSNELLGLVAEKMAIKITAEDQIPQGLTELENSPLSISDYAAFLQRESDRRVSDATKTHEQTLRNKYEFKEKKADEGKPAGASEGVNDVLQKQLAAILAKVEQMEQKEQRQNLHNDFIKKLSEKKIPASFARGRNIESAEQIDTLVAEAESEYTELKQSVINEELGGQGTPPNATGGKKTKQATDKELEAVMTNIKI